MDPPANLSYFTLSTPAPGEANRSSFDAADPRPRLPLLSVFGVLVLTLLGFLVAATFAWNLLVLATILRVRTFHRVPHNLMASMAISDVLVAALVMPLSLVHELSGRRWQLGRRLCQLWIACDVLCCTASIWNVTAIALDRYWSITRHLEYTLRARRRVSNVMIALTWALSALIALAPLLFGWGEAYDARLQRCQVSQEPSYAVFSTCGAFYLPLGVVLFVYWKIYKAAKFRFGRRCRAVLPLPSTVQVRRGLGNGDLGKGSLRDEEAWRKEELEVQVCTLGGSFSGWPLGAHPEFAICSAAAHAGELSTRAWRAHEGFMSRWCAGRGGAGEGVPAPTH